jgi:iron complex transport system substrate-binding protein
MRIASLSPAATEILFALGVGKQIVCTDQFSNFPEEAKAIPHVRDMVKIDPEDVRKFQPDAVFLGTSIQTKLSEVLRTAGFSVIHDDPRTIDDIFAWIRSIGTIVDRGKEANALVLQMQKGFQEVKKKAKMMCGDVPPARLYIEEWPAVAHTTGAIAGRHDFPYASGNWVPEIARIAGGEQFPVPPGALSPEVTLDQVEQWNPDLIVISWCGAGILAPKELLLNRPGWDRLTAIQKGHVRVIDDSLLNRPGPRLVEGARRLYGWMFEILH